MSMVHLEPCQTRYRRVHGDTISVYPDIGHDIGYDIADTRYRVLYRNIPISGHNVPDIVSCVTRCRVIQCSDVVTFEHDIGSDVAHDVACCLQGPGPGPGLAFRLQPPFQNY